MDISEKLSRKSEECESLMEERDMMRSKSSFDLQQVGVQFLALLSVFSPLNFLFQYKNVGLMARDEATPTS